MSKFLLPLHEYRLSYYCGEKYYKEFGWGPGFEAKTARLVADILDNDDPERERVFVAESVETSQFLGSIALLKHKEEANAAHLRLFLVEPASRGSGLGARLVDECVLFARERGYAKIVLWTFTVLESARRLYKRAGFQLISSTEEEEHWGTKLVPELWELELSNVPQEGQSG